MRFRVLAQIRNEGSDLEDQSACQTSSKNNYLSYMGEFRLRAVGRDLTGWLHRQHVNSLINDSGRLELGVKSEDGQSY